MIEAIDNGINPDEIPLDVNPDLIRFWVELEQAVPAYLEAERYYHGYVAEVFASERIRTMLEVTGRRYRFNLASTPVDTLADRVELLAVTVPGSEDTTSRIAEIWDANDMDVWYPHTLLNTFMYGDAYLLVWPVFAEPDPGSELEQPTDPADQKLQAAGVEFTFHSPLHCRVLYDPENQRRKALAGKRWCLPSPAGEAWRVDLYYTDRIERWFCPPGQRPENPQVWQMWTEADEDGTGWLLPNPYGEIPFFHHRTWMPYGYPVHRAAYGPQDAITKMLVTLLTTTDSQGFPQRYGLVDAAAELDSNRDGPDYLDDLDSEDLSTVVGGTDTALRSGPGSMQDLVGYKAVGQFETASPTVFTDPTELFVRLMAQTTRMPMHYFDPSGDVPSGESLKTADAPLAKLADRQHKMQRSPVSEEWLFALRVLGVLVPAVEPRWAPAQVSAGRDDWEIAKLKQEIGVPQGHTLIEAGYDPDQVSKWLDTEAEAMALQARVGLLNLIGDAMQKIGTGVSLGLLDEAEASRVISQVLGQAAPSDGGEVQ